MFLTEIEILIEESGLLIVENDGLRDEVEELR
jgi:hypothetical protein